MADKNTAAVKKKGGPMEYFRGVKTEIKKVIWPTRHELWSYAGVVVITCAFFAIGFGVVDNIFLHLLRLIIGA